MGLMMGACNIILSQQVQPALQAHPGMPHTYSLFFAAPAFSEDTQTFRFRLISYPEPSQRFLLEQRVVPQGGYYFGTLRFRHPGNAFLVFPLNADDSAEARPFHADVAGLLFLDSIAPSLQKKHTWALLPASLLSDHRRSHTLLYTAIPPLKDSTMVRWAIWHGGRAAAQRTRPYHPIRRELPILWPVADSLLTRRCDSITLRVGLYHRRFPCRPLQARILSALYILDSLTQEDLFTWLAYRAAAENRSYEQFLPNRQDSLFYFSRTMVMWYDSLAYRYFQQALQTITYVNTTFSSGHQRGMLTDRGRVYVQYGPPSDVWGHDFDPGTPPYQIWKYNVTPRRRNAIFVFYNPTGIANEFQLIHSNAYGEVSNPRWRQMLYQKFGWPADINDPGGRDYFGGSLRWGR